MLSLGQIASPSIGVCVCLLLILPVPSQASGHPRER